MLILGSMPGAVSLNVGQYYAHPRNVFWKIMGELAGAGSDKPYAERGAILKAHRIALWDVLRSCVRLGSLDADIRDEAPNDFAAHPHIKRIGCNGAKAAASFRKYAATTVPSGAEIIILPSTSPAHAGLSFEKKCAAWRIGLAL